MKVLWFEVTEPSAYTSVGTPLGGWQDSLERVVRTVSEIELTIVFMSSQFTEEKVIDGVRYVPIYSRWSFFERTVHKHWDIYVKKMLPAAKRIIEQYKPDIIHVFGTEWLFGQIAAYTSIPVVIHIMGAIVPYNNAGYPPCYSYEGELYKNRWNLVSLFRKKLIERNNRNWEEWERRTWSLVENYMGRTCWDESLSRVLHPGRKYFHVEEALRTPFVTGKRKWNESKSRKIILVSTGISTFWKGPDMMLKVAYILKSLSVDFEWSLVGNINTSLKETVEKQEGHRFEDCNLRVLGFKQPEELIDILCNSTIYVHTAYIDNSPNSICEAQCLGVPVISTNVGGIPTLVRDGIDGVLVPANDPWQMADAIIQLSSDKERLKLYSETSRSFALRRHDDEQIKRQLMFCYNTLLDK